MPSQTIKPTARIPATLFRLTAAGILSLAACAVAFAQADGTEALSHGIPATLPGDAPGARMGYGFLGLDIPPARFHNATSERTARLLGEALRRSGATVAERVLYVGDLGRTRLPAAVPLLRSALSDGSPLVRAQVAGALAEIADPALSGELQPLLADTEPLARAAAISALDALQAQRTTDLAPIIAALNDPEATVRRAAINGVRTPGESAALIERLPSLPGALRVPAIRAIGRAGTVAQAQALPALMDQDIAQRVAVLGALGQLKATDRQALVIGQLAHEHASVRRAAMSALRAVAPATTAQAQAVAHLDDKDPTVRQAAAETLAPVPSVAVAQALVELLTDPYRPLHQALRQSLIHPGDAAVRQATIEAVVPLLDSADPRRREDASYILGRLGSDAALERHIALAAYSKGADEALVAQAAESLGLIGDRRAAEALLALSKYAKGGSMMSGPEIPVPIITNALVALGRLGDARVIPDARRALAGDAEFTAFDMKAGAAYAVGAAGTIGDTALTGMLTGVLNGDKEAAVARAEAAKALGNLHLRSAEDALRKIVQNNPSPLVAWSAHWALARLTGQTIPYQAPAASYRADVSIQDWQ